MSTKFSKVKDSGEKRRFTTGAERDFSMSKGRFDLLPCHAIERLAKHYQNGAQRYEDRGWEKGFPLSTFLDSGLRHAFQVLAGQTDEDHAAAVVWNFMGFIETKHRIELGLLPKDLDDLPKIGKPIPEGFTEGTCKCGNKYAYCGHNIGFCVKCIDSMETKTKC